MRSYNKKFKLQISFPRYSYIMIRLYTYYVLQQRGIGCADLRQNVSTWSIRGHLYFKEIWLLTQLLIKLKHGLIGFNNLSRNHFTFLNCPFKGALFNWDQLKNENGNEIPVINKMASCLNIWVFLRLTTRGLFCNQSKPK